AMSEQGGAETDSAIENQGRLYIGQSLLDIAFNDGVAQVHGPWQMPVSALIIFSHVNARHLFTSVQAPFDLAKIRLLNARLGIVNQSQKAGRMSHGIDLPAAKKKRRQLTRYLMSLQFAPDFSSTTRGTRSG